MQDVQQVFNEIQESKKEMKEIRKEYRDVLAQDAEYQEVIEQINALKEQKKLHELKAQRDMGTRWQLLEEEKGILKGLKELMSDITIKGLVNGETTQVRDEFDNLHEPQYNVNFKLIH